MNRSEFQRLAEERLADAKSLLDASRWSGAYYLAGYAVECALKTCIAKLTKADAFPPNRKAVEAIYTHDLTTLIESAGLRDEFSLARKSDRILANNWLVVNKWTEATRYSTKQQADAKDILEAITEPNHGVLTWIKQHW